MMKEIFKENGALVLAEGVGSAKDDWLLCRLTYIKSNKWKKTRNYQKEKNKHRQNDPNQVGRGQRLEAKSTDWRSPVFIELKVDERAWKSLSLYAMVFSIA